MKDVEVGIELAPARQLQIETTERRSWISRDQRGCMKASSAIVALVIKDHTYKRLHATDEQASIFQAVSIVQSDCSLE
jgi:hypothetical protein